MIKRSEGLSMWDAWPFAACAACVVYAHFIVGIFRQMRRCDTAYTAAVLSLTSSMFGIV